MSDREIERWSADGSMIGDSGTIYGPWSDGTPRAKYTRTWVKYEDHCNIVKDLKHAIMTAKAEAYEDAAKIAEVQEARIAELEKALKEAVGLLKDIDLGRSIHNSRKPDQNIDGPLWAQVPRIVELSRAALSKPQTQ